MGIQEHARFDSRNARLVLYEYRLGWSPPKPVVDRHQRNPATRSGIRSDKLSKAFA